MTWALPRSTCAPSGGCIAPVSRIVDHGKEKAMTLSHGGGLKHARGQVTANKPGAATMLDRTSNKADNHLRGASVAGSRKGKKEKRKRISPQRGRRRTFCGPLEDAEERSLEPAEPC